MTNAETQGSQPDILDAIGRMTDALAKLGIAKDKTGKAGSETFKCRGIDDIRNAIAPLQAECKLNIVPKMIGRTQEERQTKNGGYAVHVVIKVEFHLISRMDGSREIVPIEIEAIDYSDKATSKALSQAYKNMAINTFNIPTEGEEDLTEKIEIKGKKNGVFDSPDLRQTYVGNCLNAFTNAESALGLKEIEGFYHEKLILMAHSEDDQDKAEAGRCRELYSRRLKELSENAKPKTVTVESAKKTLAL